MHNFARAAACALLLNDGKVLLVKRKYPPSRGLWCLPGGCVESGESVESAVHREIEEELGLRVNSETLFGVYSDIEFETVVVVYLFLVSQCDITLGEEVRSAQWFAHCNIPWHSLAFPSTHQALRDLTSVWSADRVDCGPGLTTRVEPGTQKTICIDFDGVISSVSQGYQGPGVFGKPLPGAKQALTRLRNLGWCIIVFTSRDEREAIGRYMRRYHLPYDFINTDCSRQTKPVIKLLADVYLDDKALTFTGDWEAIISKIESFRPWHQK